MTEKLKVELKQNLQALADTIYNNMLVAMESAEAVFPEGADESQKEQIMRNVIESTFKAQQNAILSGFNKVQNNLANEDYMKEVLKNVRQS